MTWGQSTTWAQMAGNWATATSGGGSSSGPNWADQHYTWGQATGTWAQPGGPDSGSGIIHSLSAALVAEGRLPTGDGVPLHPSTELFPGDDVFPAAAHLRLVVIHHLRHGLSGEGELLGAFAAAAELAMQARLAGTGQIETDLLGNPALVRARLAGAGAIEAELRGNAIAELSTVLAGSAELTALLSFRLRLVAELEGQGWLSEERDLGGRAAHKAMTEVLI